MGENFADGESGNDAVDGEGGKDGVNGGTGNDSLVGGTGNDKFSRLGSRADLAMEARLSKHADGPSAAPGAGRRGRPRGSSDIEAGDQLHILVREKAGPRWRACSSAGARDRSRCPSRPRPSLPAARRSSA
ncbi:MAG: hypothetical protein H0U25_12635 [Thermoleophilaceae bacterium]|nr:hypothetical protein [Thermoleophilaceae bacterium]